MSAIFKTGHLFKATGIMQSRDSLVRVSSLVLPKMEKQKYKENPLNKSINTIYKDTSFGIFFSKYVFPFFNENVLIVCLLVI